MTYSIISLGLNLVMNILLYKWLGMVGPAISTLVVAFIYMLLILGDTTKTIHAKWTQVFNFKELFGFTATLGVVWFAAFLLNKQVVAWGAHRYLAMILSMAVFGLSILALYGKRIFGVLKKINSFKL